VLLQRYNEIGRNTSFSHFEELDTLFPASVAAAQNRSAGKENTIQKMRGPSYEISFTMRRRPYGHTVSARENRVDRGEKSILPLINL
jgi:hypothetical protein